MKNDSPQNFNCEFAPEIVDFVYGEMGSERKNVFDLHLNDCSNCADELQDFSGIRFSIQDWKAAEFDKLATPEIKIPYQITPVKIVENEKPASWFDAVRSYLTLSPLMSGAMAVLILAVMAGFGFFIFNNNDSELMAVSNVKPNSNNEKIAIPQNPIEPKVEIVKDESADSDKNIPVENIDNSLENQPVEKRVPVQINNGSNLKQKSQAVKTIEKKQMKFDSTISDKNPKTATVKTKPRLNELPEEIEDNSLRLTDLFAELETRK